MRIPLIHARRPFVAAALVALVACSASPSAREAAPLVPPDPEALLADGDAALQRGELPEAARAYRQAAEASEDEAVAEQATQVSFDHFQLREAALAADRWLALNPTNEQARRYAGVVALELHRLDAAEEHFARLLETAYLSPAAGFLALQPILADHGTAADVTELFGRLAARHPKVAEGQYAFGSAALRSENYALALEGARQATQIAPYWIPAKFLLARALVASGQDEEGLAAARDLVMAPEADVASHLEYALLLASTGRDEEAQAMLTPYATGTTVIPGAVRSLGVLDLQRGDLDAANTRFENLLSTGAQSYEALYYLAVVAERRGDLERAARYYARVTGGDYALNAQQRVAKIKAEQSGVEAGLAHLDEFGRAQPGLGPDIVAARAGLVSALGDEKRAIEILGTGLQRFPDSVDLRMARVFAFERAGRDDAAVRELRDLLRERPGDGMVQNALGYTLADAGRELDEAHSLIAAALAQTPDSAAVLDSMGWVLFRQGRPAEALPYLERARELGDDAELDLHLGEVQWALGDKAAARRTWQEGLERRPDAELLKERLERAGP
jgi:tetratricopeptide (TPR) repeat protein